jgi:2,4-dienoyl-CoA reductase-like NADH-dependent reductase (Old Yellow Enzyme family)/thioredoxin reductase
MSKKYQNLLSPIKLGNVVFRNRMIAAPSMPHFLQGPEPFPTEALITHFAKKAKNGAALVTCSRSKPAPLAVPKELLEGLPAAPDRYVKGPRSMGGHFVALDAWDPQCQHYLSQLTEAIHFYGAQASMQIIVAVPIQYDVSSGLPSMAVFGDKSVPTVGIETPALLLDLIAEAFGSQGAIMKELGFDMVFLHMAYRMMFLGRFLSPLTNIRTDEYGGSLENMARFPIMVADRIKQKCGKDFLIEATVSGMDPPGGRTLEDTIELVKLLAGHFDLLHIKAPAIDPTHPTGFTPERTPFLSMAEAIRKSNPGVAISTVGGYLDPQASDDVIASGKADFIAMARAWISNPNYGRLLYEDRAEDIVPCLRCNACHRSSYADPWASVCAVNPILGMEHKIERMVESPTEKKNIAVVGGGPAGMEAALIAAGRGHRVTLYEKSDVLGGLLKTTDTVSFKWPQKDFKDYLIRQVAKANISVVLNTEATPELLTEKEYDVVLAAVGSEPIVPPIPGIDGKNVVFAKDVYGNEDKLAEKVVIIGGGEVGVETGMHLAEKGHDVTVLEMRDMLAPDSTPIHFYTMFREAWEKLPNFRSILQARCTAISTNSVTYVVGEGEERNIEAGSVVIAVGMKAKQDQAMKFYGAGERFSMIGDCNVAGNIQKAMRSAFGIASGI